MTASRWRIIVAATAMAVGSATSAVAAPAVKYAGQTGTARATMYQPEWLDAPPALTAAQQARMEAFAARERGHGALAPAAANLRIQGPTTEATVEGIAQELTLPEGDTVEGAGVEPAAANTFTLFRNSVVELFKGVPPLSSSDVNEPSHANSGKDVFYVGNWYAARSSNGGSSFPYTKFVNPYADFADFCCDQDVVYDDRRDMIIWYRQGVQLGGGNNNIKIGVSLNGGTSWAQYTITYTNYSGLPLGWFDYPHLAVSDNYLWFTTNYFNTNGTFQRMILTKISLDQLQAQGGISWTWWSRTTGWTWTPVQGAKNVMYVGDHTNQTAFNVCDQPEANSTLSCRDVAVPAWTATGRGAAVCTTPNGWNPCARLDQRVNAGWYRDNDDSTNRPTLGFFWTVAQGAGFPYPYVNAVEMDAQTFVPLAGGAGRPLIWNGGFAFVYAGAAPNRNGALGISTWLIGGGNHPKCYVGIDDDFNGDPPGWEIAHVKSSGTTLTNRWGDYTRVREHGPDGNTWSASCHTTQLASGTTKPLRQEPSYVIFGRGRDKDGYDRFRTK